MLSMTGMRRISGDDGVGDVAHLCGGCSHSCAGGHGYGVREEGKEQVMFGGGYKKKKILKLAKEYASKRELGWETYYREMSGLLR